MAREEKHYELRPVDDAPAAKQEVVRLESGTAPKSSGSLPRAPKPLNAERIAREGAPSQALEALQAPAIEAPTPESTWVQKKARPKGISWGWISLLAVFAAGGLGWATFGIHDATLESNHRREMLAATIQEAEQTDEQAVLLIDRIHATLAAYCATATVEDLAKWVRQPERVRPLMTEYYSHREWSPQPLTQVRLLEPAALGTQTQFWVAVVEAGDKRLNFLLEATEDHEVKIDWETAVCHQPMNWDRYALERPEGTLDFRVYAQLDNFYSHEFADSAAWYSFRLTTLNGEEFVFGYAPRDSEIGHELITLVAKSRGQRLTLLLRLNLPPDLNSRRGVLIEKIVSPYWMLLEEPSSEP